MGARITESPAAKRLYRAVILAVLIIYGASCAGSIRTALPWTDEGWFADPAYNLLTRGVLANSTLDPTFGFGAARVTGINRHTYWIMPLYLLAQTAWYRLIGFDLFSMRELSLFWGLAALAAWFFVLRDLLHDEAIATGAIAFMALDFHFIWASTTGRMDMMAVALGFAALAVYLHWRADHFLPAVFAANCLMAAALFTHPYAILLFLDLAILVLLFDARRLFRITSLAAAAAPYLAGLVAWGRYIMQDTASFRAQFGGNAAARYDGLLLFTSPWTAVYREVTKRYLEYYGVAFYSTGLSRLKLLILLTYIAAVVGILLVRKLRTHPRYRILLLMTSLHCFLLMAFDGKRVWTYLIYIVPMFATLLAVFVVNCWRDRLFPRPALAAACALFLAVQCATTWSRIWHDDYDRRFLPVTQFLSSHAKTAKVIMGPSELAFQLGFHGNVVDDTRLGCRSGKQADYIVIDTLGYAASIMHLRDDDPNCYHYIHSELAHDYRTVYDAGGYTIYQRWTD
jgi:4-amino-4-deoxy-L-arabinose transferase-like glycosyltransferase